MIELPGPVVAADWLAHHLHEVAVADVRWSIDRGPKWDDYEKSHLPGAIFVDLDSELSDPPGSGGRHPLPDRYHFEAMLQRRGFDRLPVVCYDDQSGATAARMWWMMDVLGYQVAVLDGGIQAWTGPLESGVTPSDREPGADRNIGGAVGAEDNGRADRGWPRHRLIEADAVLDHMAQSCCLLDARSRDRFVGRPNAIDPRFGHIPGASSRPWTHNIGDDGRFHAADELRRSFASQGVKGVAGWMASCGSGVTACHILLAGRLAGLPDGLLYVGSWSQWAADPDRPVETGPGRSDADPV